MAPLITNVCLGYRSWEWHYRLVMSALGIGEYISTIPRKREKIIVRFLRWTASLPRVQDAFAPEWTQKGTCTCKFLTQSHSPVATWSQMSQMTPVFTDRYVSFIQHAISTQSLHLASNQRPSFFLIVRKVWLYLMYQGAERLVSNRTCASNWPGVIFMLPDDSGINLAPKTQVPRKAACITKQNLLAFPSAQRSMGNSPIWVWISDCFPISYETVQVMPFWASVSPLVIKGFG